MIRSCRVVLAAFFTVSLIGFAQDKIVPLAQLPSKQGAHIEKIKAIGDNQWLNLDLPATDPKSGTARGSSWGQTTGQRRSHRQMDETDEASFDRSKDLHRAPGLPDDSEKRSGWVFIKPGYVGVVTNLTDNLLTKSVTGIQNNVLPPVSSQIAF